MQDYHTSVAKNIGDTVTNAVISNPLAINLIITDIIETISTIHSIEYGKVKNI